MTRFPLRSLPIAALLISSSAAYADTYTITDLGGLGGMYYYGYGINDSGVVVGASSTPTEGLRAFKYSGGSASPLVTTGPSKTSYGYGVNQAGTVVGSNYRILNGSAYERAVIYANGQAFELTGQGSAFESSSARAIANNGTVVGGSTDKGAFVYSTVSNTTTYLGTLLGTTGSATLNATNNAGTTFVGSSVATGVNTTHAMMYANGVMTDLGSLGGRISVANGISESGTVIGYSYLSGVNFQRAFTWSNGVMSQLGSLGGADTIARAINDVGTTVGVSGQQATIWNGTTAVNLNGLLAPGTTGWTLRDASAINNKGQITGWGTFGGGYHAFLLTPTAVPEPGTWAALGLGAAALVRRRRKA